MILDLLEKNVANYYTFSSKDKVSCFLLPNTYFVRIGTADT